MANYYSDNKYCQDIIDRLPDEVWNEARNEVLNANNQGVWQMCLVAVDNLIEYYETRKEELGDLEEQLDMCIATIKLLSKDLCGGWQIERKQN